MHFKYNLDDVPPVLELILLGLQWMAIAIPPIIIIGKVVATLHYSTPLAQVQYLQKLCFIVAVGILIEVLWGHRLPVMIGPSSVLLVGITTSLSSGVGEIYTAILVGGLVLAVLSVTGLFGYLKNLFTTRVVTTVLILIAVTLTPTILNLIINSTPQVAPLFNLLFALAAVFCLFLIGRHLTGLWKTTLIFWAIIIGSACYLLLFPQSMTNAPADNLPLAATFFSDLNWGLSVDPGILLSFLICFLALLINDLGSIQSVGEMLRPENMPGRVTRGVFLTGIINVFSGLLGVIGSVNLSFSPGLIATTGVASRFPLIPAGIGLLVIAFLPQAIALMGMIPSVVIGSALIYLMCSQIAAGLAMLFSPQEPFRFDHGLIIGLPVMLGMVISFLPANVLNTFPPALRPILGNGFAVGVLAVLFMEHIVYKQKK